MARGSHRRTRRRSYGQRCHDFRQHDRLCPGWVAAEADASLEAADLAASREAEAAIPVAYTTLTDEDWVTTDRPGLRP